MKTFAEFTASRVYAPDLRTAFNDNVFEPNTAGYVYGGDCHVEQLPDGRYRLQWLNDEHVADTVEELEPVLYAYLLTECPDEMGVPEDVHMFLCELQNDMGMENFAKAMRENMAEEYPGVCRMHDYCDANQCSINVAEMFVTDRAADLDAVCELAADIYDKATPFLRGGVA